MTGHFLRLILGITFLFIVFHGKTQPDRGLIRYWGFDENGGKLTTDEVSHQKDSIHYIVNNIKPFNDPVRRKGILNGALVFDGFSNWIEQPSNNFETPLDAITVSVRVAPRAFEHGDRGKISA